MIGGVTEMIQRLTFTVLLAFAVSLLTACESVQSPKPYSESTTSFSTNAGGLSVNVPGLAKCGGTHGFLVRPCPVVLRKAKGVEVTASAPGIYYAAPGDQCQNYCAVKDMNPPPYVHFLVIPGRSCGDTVEAFTAYNYSLEVIGDANLYIENKYCPDS
jgi:hypothetical protein